MSKDEPNVTMTQLVFANRRIARETRQGPDRIEDLTDNQYPLSDPPTDTDDNPTSLPFSRPEEIKWPRPLSWKPRVGW